MKGKQAVSVVVVVLLLLAGVVVWYWGAERVEERSRKAPAEDSVEHPFEKREESNAPEGQPRVSIDEWEVPWDRSRPRDPAVGDHRIWFVGQEAGFAATFDLVTQSFMRYPLVEGSGPHNIIISGDTAWYAGNLRDHIGELDIESGIVTPHEVPAEGDQDPHTLVFSADGKGIWFTAQLSNLIGYFDIQKGEYRLQEVPTANARPYGIALDGSGTPWVALFGTNKLARIDPQSGAIKEIELTREAARPRRLSVTGDDVWYVDYVGGWLGRYDMESGDVDEWRAPSGAESGPYAMAADAKGRLWFVETGVTPNRLVAFDPESEEFVVNQPIPSGGDVVRNMVYDRDTNALWFGTDANTLVRAKIDG